LLNLNQKSNPDIEKPPSNEPSSFLKFEKKNYYQGYHRSKVIAILAFEQKTRFGNSLNYVARLRGIN
jgi:hypothetical protein